MRVQSNDLLSGGPPGFVTYSKRAAYIYVCYERLSNRETHTLDVSNQDFLPTKNLRIHVYVHCCTFTQAQGPSTSEETTGSFYIEFAVASLQLQATRSTVKSELETNLRSYLRCTSAAASVQTAPRSSSSVSPPY